MENTDIVGKGNTDAEREGSGESQQHRWEKAQEEKESLSAEGSQAEAQSSPITNAIVSSLSSATLGVDSAYSSGRSYGADYIICNLFWLLWSTLLSLVSCHTCPQASPKHRRQ